MSIDNTGRLFEIIRGVLGLPSRRDSRRDTVPEDNFRNPIWDQGQEDEDELDDRYRNVPKSPFGFHIFTGDPLELHRYFEYQFDEMLKNFRALESPMFGNDLVELPDFIGPNGESEKPTEESIRDKYLKPSYEMINKQNAMKSDSDLDDKVTSGDITALFPSESRLGHEVPARAFGQSITTKTIRLPDGRVEHKKIVKRSDGNEEVTVTRKFGDQTYSVTTTTDASGAAKTTEELINIDQDKLSDFEKEWGKQREPQFPFQADQPQHNLFKLLPPFDKFFK